MLPKSPVAARPLLALGFLASRFFKPPLVSFRQRRHLATKSFKKVMVANRGEIAIRVFRTLRELQIGSVAVFAHADRYNLHIEKADEAYQVGEGKDPVGDYLNIDSIIQIAKQNKVDAIHPGYGFLSERHDFAERVIQEGMCFIGPSPDVMARMGDKVAARKSAIEAGVKVVLGTDEPITSAEEAIAFAKEHGTPIILKAAYGGGGRGMRRVDDIDEVGEAFNMASREALANFGNGSMFVEKYLIRPRHIEVQLLGDHHGNVVHLYERDCSVQRRHQKVVEIAPAVGLDPKIRERILDDAIKLAKFVGYQNAGTVEFLVDEAGHHYFIEVNARLQVEHTVTEEITGIDLVRAQIKVAEGASLPDLDIFQEDIAPKFNAIQVRITTEDPSKDFQPDTGRVEVYRPGAGGGIRLDGSAYEGMLITPHYDSLLVKVISCGASFQKAALKLVHSLDETKISGVKTNISFLMNVLRHARFLAGPVDTSFIETYPELLNTPINKQRGIKLIKYLAELKVNGNMTPLGNKDALPVRTQPIVPFTDPMITPPSGWKQLLDKEGPRGFQKAIREHAGLLLTDTTLRDAHQSLLATRVRTHDLLKIAPYVSHNLSNLLSVENWGGATFDVCMQFLRECPWERLEQLRAAIPNIPFQCLLRGANAVGYANYADAVIDQFCKLAVKSGMDIFRIFDSLNYVPNLKVGIDAVGKAGGVVEAAIAYNGDIADSTREKYNLDYYLKLADELVKMDIHILAIKDMAGVLKPNAARILIGELRSRYPHMPIHVHTHDSAGVGVASMIAAAEAGADIVDAAVDSMSGITSQPSMGALVHALSHTQYKTGVCPRALSTYNIYWEETRQLYAPFECTTTMKAGNADVFSHQIPGGQLTNLHFQSVSLGLRHDFSQVCKNYEQANLALGDIIKVTPSSKVVGDLAQFMTQHGINTKEELLDKADELSFPQSVKDFFKGLLGQPPYGFPKRLQKKVLRDEEPLTSRPGETLPAPDFVKLKHDLEHHHQCSLRDQDVMSHVMFPNVFDETVEFRKKYGPVDKLPTDVYFYGPKEHLEFPVQIEKGKTLLIKLIGVADVQPDGNREVIFSYNGQNRNIYVKDKEACKDIKQRPKATTSNQIGAPMKGQILDVKVKPGDRVDSNQTLCVLSAMKLEMAVESKLAGTVKEVLVKNGDAVDVADLLIVIEQS